MMWLPEHMEPEFRLRVEEMEEVDAMRYVTSIERLAMKEGVEKGILQGIEQGMQQGVRQGRIEGKMQVLIRLLACRFGPLPGWAKARLEAATEAELEIWTDAFVDAATIERVLDSART